MTATIILLLVVPMFGFPLFFTWFAARIERRIDESRLWPSVDGTMVRSKLYHSKGVWYPSLIYSYVVQGVERRASRYCFGGFNGTKAEVSAVLERFPMGATIPVYYDPTKPKFAVLERTGQAGAWRIVGWALAGMMLVILIVVLVALR